MKIKAFILMFVFSLPSWAFKCYFTLVKDSCWTNYKVQVRVIDATINKDITEITLPKGKTWSRVAFECQPSMKLMFAATYTPVFWESHKGRSYFAKQYLTLPAQIDDNTVALNVPICFTSDFSGVPLPPDVDGNCRCDTSDIPALEGTLKNE